MLTISLFATALYSCETHTGEKTEHSGTDSLTILRNQVSELQTNLNEKDKAIAAIRSQLDSLQADTLELGLYNPNLIGRWQVNMTCTETSCDGSAIGDTKAEQWQVSYLNESIVVQVINKGKITRTYKGNFTREGLLLEDRANRDNGAITLVMKFVSGGRMEGQRDISRPECSILYAVSAMKIVNINSKR